MGESSRRQRYHRQWEIPRETCVCCARRRAIFLFYVGSNLYFCWATGCDPQFDSVDHWIVGIFLGDACPLQNLEGVVPTFHDVKIGGSFQLLDDRPQLVRRSERVTRTLNEQHRNCDIRQMLRTKLVCSTRGMKRIAEEDEPFDVGSARGSNLGGDSAAHRFAANDQRAAADLFLPDSLDHDPETNVEGLIRVRNAPALLCVQKSERDDVNSARCEPGHKSRHEITTLIGASSVPQNHRDTGEVRLAH